MITFLKKCHASIIIQRMFRGWVSRTVSNRSRCRTRHHAMHMRYKTGASSASLHFEQQGAAHTIQMWIQKLPLHLNNNQNHLLWHAVSQIQGAWRRRCFRIILHARIRRSRRLRIKELQGKRAAAVLITRLCRGRSARMRILHMRISTRAPPSCAHPESQDNLHVHHMINKNPKLKRRIKEGSVRIQSMHRGRVARAKTKMLRLRHVSCRVH